MSAKPDKLPPTPASGGPKYRQIARHLRHEIARLGPRHLLESEAELCARFKVSRGPVRQALLALEQTGEIYRIAGRGSFVADPRDTPSAAPPAPALPFAPAQDKLPIWVLPINEYSTNSVTFERILAGIDQRTAHHGVAVTVGSLASSSGIYQMAQQGRIAGIFTGALETAILSDPVFAGIPKVWLMTRRRVPGTPAFRQPCDVVSPDNGAIGALAATYLIERGHRHLAFFNPVVEDPSATDRMAGFLGVAHEQNRTIAILDDAQLPGSRPAFHGVDHDITRLLVERFCCLQPRPTGIFIPSDVMTDHLYPLLRQRGMEPGRDITVISCNNHDETLSRLSPRPATIDLNCEEIGRAAADLMAWRSTSPALPDPITLYISPQLIPGELDKQPSQ